MGRMAIVAFAAAVAACSGGHPEAPSALIPEGSGGGSSGTSVLGGTCPDPGDAAACPMLGGEAAWVGCTRITAATNTAALVSCTCFATETGGAAWACEVTDASPAADEASASPTFPIIPPLCDACVK